MGPEEEILGKYEAILPAKEENHPRDEEMLGKYEAILPAREENDPRDEEMLGKYEVTLPAREEKLVAVDKALSSPSWQSKVMTGSSPPAGSTTFDILNRGNGENREGRARFLCFLLLLLFDFLLPSDGRGEKCG